MIVYCGSCGETAPPLREEFIDIQTGKKRVGISCQACRGQNISRADEEFRGEEK